ncbi:hypothetical protein J4475_01635 [Candidatus Woesearchaeota archaeon]|nr:hypothetical protein [Candidatus Woesearchaeota archaeon]
MQRLETIINLEPMPIEPAHFHGDARFPYIQPDNFRIRTASADFPDSLPKGVLFKTGLTQYGLVLVYEERQSGTPNSRGIALDSAVLGFNIEGCVADVLQIQGGRGRYKQLAVVKWPIALLKGMTILAHELQLGEIHVVMSHAVNGGPLDSSGIADERFMERLQRVYDLTCSALGFRQSYALNRHVLEL